MHYLGILSFQGKHTQRPKSLSEMTSQAVYPDTKSPFMIMASQISHRSKDDHAHRQTVWNEGVFPPSEFVEKREKKKVYQKAKNSCMTILGCVCMYVYV